MKKEVKFGTHSGNRTYTDLVIHAFIKMDIGSNHDVNVALYDTRNSPQLAQEYQDSRKQVEVLSFLTRKALSTGAHQCIWIGDGATTMSTSRG